MRALAIYRAAHLPLGAVGDLGVGVGVNESVAPRYSEYVDKVSGLEYPISAPLDA